MWVHIVGLCHNRNGFANFLQLCYQTLANINARRIADAIIISLFQAVAYLLKQTVRFLFETGLELSL